MTEHPSAPDYRCPKCGFRKDGWDGPIYIGGIPMLNLPERLRFRCGKCEYPVDVPTLDAPPPENVE